MKQRRNVRHRGFTLIELMLVVMIIGIICSLAIPQFFKMSARASRGEGQIVLSKLRLYFIDLYQNQGTFLTGAQAVGFTSAANPSSAATIGQSASWDPTLLGWTDFPFPPEGAVKMRYLYQITASDSITLIACGDFPGLGARNVPCGLGLMGNYSYQEQYKGTSPMVPIEFPSTF